MGALADGWTFLTDPASWWGPRGIFVRTGAHLWVSLVAVAVALAIAAPVAIWMAHKGRLPVVSVAIANLGRAIPSFAIIVLVVPLSIAYGFGLGFWPTLVALVALGIPPIFTNAYAGVAATPRAQIEAARGVGMTDLEILRRVELPAALPLILTGFRIAAVQIVATAALGALAGYECLGTFIVRGLAAPIVSRGELVGGAVLIAALAVIVELTINMVERWLTPWRKRVR